MKFKFNSALFVLLIVTFLITSCSNPLDKQFNRETAEADFTRIVRLGKIDSTEAQIMGQYMVERELIGTQILEIGATYRDILNEAKKSFGESTGKPDNNSEPGNYEELNSTLKVVLSYINEPIAISNWSKQMRYHLSAENISGKRIGAFKGRIAFYDAFNEKAYHINYKYLDPVEPGERIEKDIQIRMENVPVPRQILEFSKVNPFTVKWEPENIIFK
ncbi:MAG: hypothetical protein ACO3FI_10290 [Cyclobacteriaceae bacterium]